MADSKRTIRTLARSLDRHLSELGMGQQELIDLACALIDRAAERAIRETTSSKAA